MKLPCGNEKAQSDCLCYCSKQIPECSEEIVSLDIDLITDELYDAILKEFKIQHGEGFYVDWVITATKEKDEYKKV